MQNNCDGSGPHLSGASRVLPAGGDGNMILCKRCFEREVGWRRGRNSEVAQPYDLPTWDHLVTYGETMRTLISGKDAPWPGEVWKLWREKVATPAFAADLSNFPVLSANYYRPRPYVDEYNRGSDKEGFLFDIRHRIYFVEWVPGADS
jgi:hypothetical protein